LSRAIGRSEPEPASTAPSATGTSAVDNLDDPVAANEAALRALWVRFKRTADASTRERLLLHYSPLVGAGPLVGGHPVAADLGAVGARQLRRTRARHVGRTAGRGDLGRSGHRAGLSLPLTVMIT
jgi:hypothetical protein